MGLEMSFESRTNQLPLCVRSRRHRSGKQLLHAAPAKTKKKKHQEGEMTVYSTGDAKEISTYVAVGQF